VEEFTKGWEDKRRKRKEEDLGASEFTERKENLGRKKKSLFPGKIPRNLKNSPNSTAQGAAKKLKKDRGKSQET